MPTALDTAGTMGGEDASSIIPEKGHAGKHKTNYSEFLKDTPTVDHRYASAWPWMDLRIGL